MKFLALALIAATIPSTSQARNESGQAPQVICHAQEILRGEMSAETAFTRYDLTKDSERDDFLPKVVLQGHRFRLSVYGSINSEREIWLRIDDFLYPGQPTYSRGLESGSLTRMVDRKNFSRITCEKESELKERMLAQFCNPDGSVKSPSDPRFIDKITRDCQRLREIEVIKEEPAPAPPAPPPAPPAPPCEPSPENPCEA